MDLQPGLLVTPNVRLVELLGQGGMGSVWVADHLTLETRVAVKFISSREARRNPKHQQRFQREAALAAKIKSPHAVQIYDHGFMDSELPYIVMELLEGESLGARIRRSPLSVRETSLMISQTAEVLSRVHDAGVIHRDIKPDNLFLIDSGYELFVKVLDFGVAKESKVPTTSQMTDTGTTIGTPFYMSPELMESARAATPHADMWALAVVAYESLTGRVPFKGETIGSLAIALNSGAFTASTELRPELPHEIDEWFARALSVDPDDRFESVGELAEAFSLAAKVTDSLRPSAPETDRRIITGNSPKVSTPGAVATTVMIPSEPPSSTLSGNTTMSPSSQTLGDRKPSTRRLLVPLLLCAGLLGLGIAIALGADDETSAASAPSAATTTEASTAPSDPPAETTRQEPTSTAASAPEPSAKPPSHTKSAPPRTEPTPPVASSEPSAKPRGPCMRYDPVKKKKVYHKVCPD